MKLITEIAFVWNIIAIIILLAGLFFKFKNPKNKAVYGYALAAGMIPYLLLLSLVIAGELIIKHNIDLLYLVLCVISPFVIGKFVTYETLKKYTVVQIMCFSVSLIALYVKIFL